VMEPRGRVRETGFFEPMEGGLEGGLR
jgi:hypothetical protein